MPGNVGKFVCGVICASQAVNTQARTCFYVRRAQGIALRRAQGHVVFSKGSVGRVSEPAGLRNSNAAAISSPAYLRQEVSKQGRISGKVRR